MKEVPGMGSRRYLRYELLDYGLVYEDEDAEPVNAVVVNIGLGGVQLRSKACLPVGKSCVLKIGQDDGKTLTLRGEVRHCQQVEESDLFASGFQFVPGNHRERMDVAEYVHNVFQRQCERLIF